MLGDLFLTQDEKSRSIVIEDSSPLLGGDEDDGLDRLNGHLDSLRGQSIWSEPDGGPAFLPARAGSRAGSGSPWRSLTAVTMCGNASMENA